MEYPYFTTAPQTYNPIYLGLPPTPSHTNSANSDDFSNSPVRAPAFSYVQYHSPLTATQDAFDQFQAFDYNNFTPNGIPQPKPPTPTHKSSNGVHNGFEIPIDNDESMRRGSNSDDDDNMTPAQSRRKAQNRAAYVISVSPFPCLTTADSAPFVNAKSVTSRTSKPNSRPWKRTLQT